MLKCHLEEAVQGLDSDGCGQTGQNLLCVNAAVVLLSDRDYILQGDRGISLLAAPALTEEFSLCGARKGSDKSFNEGEVDISSIHISSSHHCLSVVKQFVRGRVRAGQQGRRHRPTIITPGR